MSWLENTDIIFENNNLLTMDVDAIVCSITTHLEEYGKISQKLFKMI